jgi:hypothetical protein
VTAILGTAQVEAGQSFRIVEGPTGEQKIRYLVSEAKPEKRTAAKDGGCR